MGKTSIGTYWRPTLRYAKVSLKYYKWGTINCVKCWFNRNAVGTLIENPIILMERHHSVCITFKNTIIFNEFKVNKQMNLSEEKGSVQRVSIGKNRLLKRNLHRGTEW